MKYAEGNRIKDLRKCDYGEGVIVGHVKDGEEFWVIRWDDSGLDNEWLYETEFERIQELCFWCHHGKGYHYDASITDVPQMPCNMSDDETGPCLCYGWCTTKEEADAMLDGQVNQIFVFPNGNVAVTNNKGEQIPELQGSWINFDYIRKLASIAIRDNARVAGRMPDDHLGALIARLGGKPSPSARPYRLHCDACGHMRHYHEDNDGHCKICECEGFTRIEGEQNGQ